MGGSIIEQKRRDLLTFIEAELAPQPEVQAVIGVGSIAAGTARRDSDIDAVIFLAPFDPYIVPAEFVWLAADRSFHSIFSDAPAVQETGIQLDFSRYDLAEWTDPNFTWPEPVRGGLHAGWIAFDRRGQVAELIAQRTAYPDATRLERLDRAIVAIDHLLVWDDPSDLWQRLGPVRAVDRVQAAYEALVAGLFAYNRAWRPFRAREMVHLLRLAWLPEACEARILTALNAPSLDLAGYTARFEMVRALFQELVDRLAADGTYGADAVSEAFIRTHDEPGRAWNMEEWRQRHKERPQESA